jgi:hypothetical protein
MSERKREFKFNLDQAVKIKDSNEHGKVISRCESLEADNNYRVRYVNTDGVATERWWFEDALQAA